MLPLAAKDKLVLQGVEQVLQKHPIIVILVNPFIDSTLPLIPWIPEPSTVNNKLKCREGSGSTGRFFD